MVADGADTNVPAPPRMLVTRRIATYDAFAYFLASAAYLGSRSFHIAKIGAATPIEE